MACACHKKTDIKQNVNVNDHTTEPYDQCLICAEKHFSAALTEAKEFGYTEENRATIAGDLECATRHTFRAHPDLAELFRHIRHEVQMRNDYFSLPSWVNVKKLLAERILAEMGTQGKGKIYLFSNVEYPESKKLAVRPEDMLVFLNKGFGIDFYKGHPNRKIYHRSPKESYGITHPEVPNFYVFGNNGKDQIPEGFIKDLKSRYDWNYEIEKGKVKSMTTGYMVAHYLSNQHPDREVILVNFGYEVKKSTYRCPWHNWKFEAEKLKDFPHIFTANTVRKDGKPSVLVKIPAWLGDNIYSTAVVENLAMTGRYEMNVSSNRPALWERAPYLNREITEENADHVIWSKNTEPWGIDTPHIIEGTLRNVAKQLNTEIPYLVKKPIIRMDIPPERLIEGKYVVINTGWQNGAPPKKWHDSYWRELISSLPEVKFVQMGQSKNHAAPIDLPNVVSMIDKTEDLKNLFQLIMDASCVISPPSGCIHIAAAYDVPFINLAGGREPENLVKYDCGVTLSTCGKLDCCKEGGCRSNNFGPVGRNCKRPHKIGDNDIAGECMAMITPNMVKEELTKLIL